MYQKALLSPKQILDVLIDAGAVKRSASLSIQSFPDDAERRRDARRQLHRIWRDGRPRIQLYIAPDLARLERRTAEFYQACPAIVCKPIIFVKHEGLDFLGLEFAEGMNAEEGLTTQAIQPDALLQSLTVLDSALSESEEPSTPQAAAEELECLFQDLHECDLLSEADRALLDSFIAPKLRSVLLGAEPRTRWTNGDFITRNIVVGRRGPKLVDYEFAARTHFYGEDWARLLRYSPSLPAAVLELAGARLNDGRNAFNIYGLLRQIVLESRMKRVGELNRETANISRQLIPFLDSWRVDAAPSLFLPTPLDPAIPGNAKAQVQVFYSDTSEFHESNTIYDDVIEGVWKRVELPLPVGVGGWHIRLDPVHCTGIVEIASLEISSAPFAHSLSIALADLRAAGTCAVASVAPALVLICYGPDPQLYLPVVPVEGPGPIRIAIWMRWERLETGLGRAATEVTRDKANEVSADRATLRLAEIKIEELTATLEQESLAAKSSQATIEDLRSGLAQLADTEEREIWLQARVAESAQQISSLEAALESEQRARMALESTLEEQAQAHVQFEELVRERQRIYDAGAVQSLARIHQLTSSSRELTVSLAELTAALNEARAERQALERAAAESAHRTAAEAAHCENESIAERERMRSHYQSALDSERIARAQADALLEIRADGHKKAEAAFERSIEESTRIRHKLEKELRERNEHQRNLEKHVAAQELRITNLERSLSWKLTAPVRQVAKLFQRAPHKRFE